MRHRTLPAVLIALAASFVTSFAAADDARADFATGGTITEIIPGDFTDSVPENPGNVAADDNALVFDKTAIFGASFVDFEATFASMQDALGIQVFTGTVTGAYLTAVSFINTSDGTSAAWFGLAPADGALASDTSNGFAFSFAPGTYQLTPIGAFTTYDHLALTFAFDNAGDSLGLDAVANPEPGTLALFGLGALGFGGFVVRRRRRAAAAAAR